MASGVSLPPRASQLRNLVTIFVAWKTLLLLTAILSPGIGYDTSSDLLGGHEDRHVWLENAPSRIRFNVLKLVRWDAIYYTETARRGQLFEQEWAFGKGLCTILSSLVQVLSTSNKDDVTNYAVVGVAVSHLSHFITVILVFKLAELLVDGSESASSTVPFVAAILHILSPAGIFLSAPYSESPFSLFNMLGLYWYAKSFETTVGDLAGTKSLYVFFAGVSFGCATFIRSNGILSGIPLFIDAVESTLRFINPRVDNYERQRLLLLLQFIMIGGCCTAIGLVYPQFLAYREYCTATDERRTWCNAWLPSIFTFVQAHYWNVGFLKYWTMSNLPLFILALPCLYLTIRSGTEATTLGLATNSTPIQKLRLRIALPQLVLSLLALTNYHVQIITRLSSGYPLWYMWLATSLKDWQYSTIVIRGLMMYGLIQAVLFASFLPPA